MKLGVSILLTDQGISPHVVGAALEQRGFDALLMPEHSHIPASRESPYPMGGELPERYYRALDPFVALGAAAATTSRLLLGTGVALAAQRDPIQAAKEVATLDHISQGRALFGVGVGWNREEMRNHGTDPTVRGRVLDERLAAIREIWTNERAEFHGEFVDFDPVFAWPKPVRTPHPPILVGGNSAAAARRAGRFDGWMPNAVRSADDLGAQLALRDEHAGERTPITATSADPRNRAVLDAYAEAGVERVTLAVADAPADTVLRTLDELAGLPAEYA